MPQLALRNRDGDLLRFVSQAEADDLVSKGFAEAVGARRVKFLRLTKGPRPSLWRGVSPCNFTTRLVGIRALTYEHVAPRCKQYERRES